MTSMDRPTADIVADIEATFAKLRGDSARIREGLDRIARDMRRGRVNTTLAEWVEWEREFGPEFDTLFPGRTEARSRAWQCRHFARKFDVPYATVKAAFQGVS
jgi:hypothetical protein